AQATPQEFSGEERIEYVSERFGSHTTAVVADFETDVLSFPQISAQDSVSQEFSICPEERCGNTNLASALAEGFRGIDRKIQQELLYLRGATGDRRQSRREPPIDHRLLAHGEPDEIDGFLHHSAKIEVSHNESPFAGVGEHLPT